MKQYIKLLEEKSNSASWYFGLADCNGIDAFVKQQADEDEVAGVDFLDDLGLSDQSGNELRDADSAILGMLKIRAHHNTQRHPVMYRVKLEDWAADYIENLFRSGKSAEALIKLKGLAEVVQLARVAGVDAKKAWARIPDKSLSPI